VDQLAQRAVEQGRRIDVGRKRRAAEDLLDPQAPAAGVLSHRPDLVHPAVGLGRQRPMGRTPAGQFHADRQRPPLRSPHQLAQPAAEPVHEFVGRFGPGRVQPAEFPSQDVQPLRLGLGPLLVVDGDQHTSLGSRLADVPGLHVAGKDHQRLAAEDFRLWTWPKAQ